jgi:hypothetical protein
VAPPGRPIKIISHFNNGIIKRKDIQKLIKKKTQPKVNKKPQSEVLRINQN